MKKQQNIAVGKQHRKQSKKHQSPLSVELVKIIKECVGKLNQLAQKECATWVDRGRIVHEFVERIRGKRQRKGKVDGYRLLADAPENLHGATQLRNLDGCYLLYQEFGGGTKAPKVKMTHYVLVLGTAFSLKIKRDLLKMAERENLSVAELKKRLKAIKPPRAPRAGTFESALTQTMKLADKTLSELSALIHRDDCRQHPIPEADAARLLALAKYIIDNVHGRRAA
jgi:hypothetical protein